MEWSGVEWAGGDWGGGEVFSASTPAGFVTHCLHETLVHEGVFQTLDAYQYKAGHSHTGRQANLKSGRTVSLSVGHEASLLGARRAYRVCGQALGRV